MKYVNKTLIVNYKTENCRVYFLYDLKHIKEKNKKKLFFMINYCEEKLEKLGCEIVDEFKSGIVIGNC